MAPEQSPITERRPANSYRQPSKGAPCPEGRRCLCRRSKLPERDHKYEGSAPIMLLTWHLPTVRNLWRACCVLFVRKFLDALQTCANVMRRKNKTLSADRSRRWRRSQLLPGSPARACGCCQAAAHPHACLQQRCSHCRSWHSATRASHTCQDACSIVTVLCFLRIALNTQRADPCGSKAPWPWTDNI